MSLRLRKAREDDRIVVDEGHNWVCGCGPGHVAGGECKVRYDPIGRRQEGGLGQIELSRIEVCRSWKQLEEQGEKGNAVFTKGCQLISSYRWFLATEVAGDPDALF